MHQGDPLAQIDPRPYEAALQQMQGNLRRDQALLADARLDLKRYEGLVKEDSIAQQQLDTQRALVDQYVGTIESDEGQVKTASVNSDVHAHRRAGHRPRRIAPGRSRKLRHAGRHERHRRDQPAAADHRHLPHPRGQRARADAAAARGRPDDGGGLRPHQQREARAKASCSPWTTRSTSRPARSSCARNSRMPTACCFRISSSTSSCCRNCCTNQIIIPNAAVRRGAPNGVVSTFVYVVNPDRTVKVRPVTLGVVDGERVAVTKGLKRRAKSW